MGLFQVNSRGNIVKFKDVDGLNVFCFKEKIKGLRSRGKHVLIIAFILQEILQHLSNVVSGYSP